MARIHALKLVLSAAGDRGGSVTCLDGVMPLGSQDRLSA